VATGEVGDGGRERGGTMSTARLVHRILEVEAFGGAAAPSSSVVSSSGPSRLRGAGRTQALATVAVK
jgi:hypothetical protein